MAKKKEPVKPKRVDEERLSVKASFSDLVKLSVTDIPPIKKQPIKKDDKKADDKKQANLSSPKIFY